MNNINDDKLNFFQRNAKILVIFGVACGATSGVLGKLITASSMAIGFYRLLFALPFFAVPVLLHHREELKSLEKKDYALCGISGFFLFLHFFCWFNAVQTTTIASAVVLQSLHPLVVLLVTLLIFKQPVKMKAAFGIIIALVGGVFIAGFNYTMTGNSVLGDVFAILTGIFYGLYFCVGNVARKRITSSVYIFLVFFCCSLSFTVGMIVTSTPFGGYPPIDFVWLILMTLICQIGSHALFNWSLGYVSSLYISTTAILDIVISTVFAIIVISEFPTLWQCIGAVIVITGLVIYNFNEK